MSCNSGAFLDPPQRLFAGTVLDTPGARPPLKAAKGRGPDYGRRPGGWIVERGLPGRPAEYRAVRRLRRRRVRARPAFLPRPTTRNRDEPGADQPRAPSAT